MSIQKKLLRNFTNRNVVSEHLYCPICLEVFDNPLRAECGHTYCCLCIYQWIEAHKTCPVCKNKIKSGKHLQTDMIPQKIIGDLEVQCAIKECYWRGRNEDLRAHYIKCKFRQEQKPLIHQHYDVIQIVQDAKEKEIIDLDDE